MRRSFDRPRYSRDVVQVRHAPKLALFMARAKPRSSSTTATGEADAPPFRPFVQLFTDGACSGNPGPGGWAYILKHPASGTEREASGGEARTTNNRMELTAVIEGLQAIKRPSAVEIVSDSQYVVKGLTEWIEGWKRNGWTRGGKGRPREPVMNADLWQRLEELRRIHDVRLQWVRGHNEHPENERCDRLAVAAIERLRSA